MSCTARQSQFCVEECSGVRVHDEWMPGRPSDSALRTIRGARAGPFTLKSLFRIEYKLCSCCGEPSSDPGSEGPSGLWVSDAPFDHWSQVLHAHSVASASRSCLTSRRSAARGLTARPTCEGAGERFRCAHFKQLGLSSAALSRPLGSLQSTRSGSLQFISKAQYEDLARPSRPGGDSVDRQLDVASQPARKALFSAQ